MGLPSPSLARALALLGALLAISALAVVGRLATAAHAAPVELFFSEYIEGSSNNKALEIYNGTGAPVTLTGTYDVQIFANGSALPTATIPLTGTVADGDVFVLAQVNAVAAILTQTDQTTSNFLFNGDDGVALRKAGTIIDVIGQIGSDPGTEWGSGATSTADNTLERKAVVQTGDANGSDAFDPATRWDGFVLDTFSGLGARSVSGGGGGPPGGGGGLNATDDAGTLEEDDEAIPLGALGNDSGTSLTIVSVTDPANGSATLSAGGGDVSYEPDVDFNGTDSFTYSVSDSSGQVDTATVTVTVSPVNDDPDPEDDAASTPEDVAVTLDVLANDDDVDGDSLSVSVVEGATHGAATVAADGEHVSFVPDPDWSGVEMPLSLFSAWLSAIRRRMGSSTSISPVTVS